MRRSGVRSSSAPPLFKQTNRSRLVFRPFPPVLARVRAFLRRTPPPRTAPYRAVFVLSCRPFSVSAEQDFAPGPATARVSGCLFVTEAAFTQATQPWNGLPAHDGPNVPGDRRLGSIAHHLATLDAVVQVFCQRFVVLRNFCLMARSTALRKAVLNVLPPQTRPRAHPGALHGRGAARGRRRALRGEDGAPCRPVAAAAGGNGAAGCGDRGPSAGAVVF